MEFARRITLETNPEEARRRAMAFFAQAGYRQDPSAPVLSFWRNSRYGAFYSPSPRGWRVEATAVVEPAADRLTEVTATLKVYPGIQALASETERRFWEEELDALEASLQGKSYEGGTRAALERAAVRHNWLAAIVMIAFLLVGAVVGARLGGPGGVFYILGGMIVGCIIGCAVGVGLVLALDRRATRG